MHLTRNVNFAPLHSVAPRRTESHIYLIPLKFRTLASRTDSHSLVQDSKSNGHQIGHQTRTVSGVSFSRLRVQRPLQA